MDGWARGREPRLSQGTLCSPLFFLSGGGGLGGHRTPGAQPLGPLFPVAAVDLVVSSGTWWQKTEAEIPRHQKGLGLVFSPLQ